MKLFLILCNDITMLWGNISHKVSVSHGLLDYKLACVIFNDEIKLNSTSQNPIYCNQKEIKKTQLCI